MVGSDRVTERQPVTDQLKAPHWAGAGNGTLLWNGGIMVKGRAGNGGMERAGRLNGFRNAEFRENFYIQQEYITSNPQIITKKVLKAKRIGP
ncbi:MAG: hypothetical protein IPM82_21315 [Saprospiraceae bacterium]|nr:hypothetical protein [Saprospiraceae bacterium]